MSVLNNSLKEFSGMLSIIQLSKFFVVVISDNFYILSRVIHFVNNFFILFFAVSYLSCDSYIRLSPIEYFVNNFFHFFHIPGTGLLSRYLRIAPCTALPQSSPIFAYRGINPTFMLISGARTKDIHLFMSKLM